MSTEPALDLTNLKDINSKLFEIQSKSVLYECMKNGEFLFLKLEI